MGAVLFRVFGHLDDINIYEKTLLHFSRLRNQISAYKLMVTCLTLVQCQRMPSGELHQLSPSGGLLEYDWVVEDENGSCDPVEEASWTRHFCRGVIVGFFSGLGGGVMFGFLCWQVQVHKKGYDLQRTD